MVEGVKIERKYIMTLSTLTLKVFQLSFDISNTSHMLGLIKLKASAKQSKKIAKEEISQTTGEQQKK